MSFDAAHCTLCPRRCGADREKGVGLCHCGTEIRIARAALHPWEEPCISGRHGSGTVFFSGCALGCVFCQNRKISRQAVGKAVTVTQLAEVFLKLQEQQAHNINLVTGSHYTPWIVQALELAKPKLHIPVGRTATCSHVESEIVGTKGTLRVNSVPRKNYLSQFTENGFVEECQESFLARWGEAFQAEIDDFVDCVRTGRKPETTAHDGTMSLKFCLQLHQAYLDGKKK